MAEVKVMSPRGRADVLYYLLGGLILMLNKIRHSIQGYTQPRPFPASQVQKAIVYDLDVVKLWARHLAEYLGPEATLKGKTILELGPGADLGVSAFTLLFGAGKYNTIDVHPLAQATPPQFYPELFNYIEKNFRDARVSVEFVRRQLEQALSGRHDRIRYVCDANFDLSVFQGQEIDLVVSQAAFEHFHNVGEVIAQLSQVVKPGAVLIAEVDLRTHTRWIRDVDPLNIYRYADPFYEALKFRGSPNRLRPFEYQQILETNGWTNIQILPVSILNQDYAQKTQDRLAGRFREKRSGMDQLIVAIRATKA